MNHTTNPNLAFNILRDEIRKIYFGERWDRNALTQAFEDLDKHLSKRGHLPARWAEGRITRPAQALHELVRCPGEDTATHWAYTATCHVHDITRTVGIHAESLPDGSASLACPKCDDRFDITLPTSGARIAFHADESFTEDGFYQVIVITKDEPGYVAVNAWPTLDAASKYADDLNQGLGLTDSEVLEIMSSSLAASRNP